MNKAFEPSIINDPQGDLITMMREELSQAIKRATDSIEAHEEEALLAVTYSNGSRTLTTRSHCLKILDSLNERFELRAGIATENIFIPKPESSHGELMLERRFKDSLRKGFFEYSATKGEERFASPDSPTHALRKLRETVLPYFISVASLVEKAQVIDAEEVFNESENAIFAPPIQKAEILINEIFERAKEEETA